MMSSVLLFEKGLQYKYSKYKYKCSFTSLGTRDSPSLIQRERERERGREEEGGRRIEERLNE